MVELALWIRVATKQRVDVFILGSCVVIVGQIKETKEIVVFLVCHVLCSQFID